MLRSSNSLVTPRLLWWKKFSTSDYVRKVSVTYVNQIAVLGLQVIITIIVARVLGPAGRGIYAVAATIGALGVRFTTFGMHASNTYYVAKRRELLPTLTGNTLLYSLVAGSFVGLGLYGVFNVLPSIAPLRGSMLVLALLWIPAGLAYILLQNLLVGAGDVPAYNSIELGAKISGLTLIIAIASWHLVSPESVFMAGLIVMGGSVLFALLRLRVIAGAPLRYSVTLVNETIAVGFRAYLISFFGFLVLRLDLLMVQKMLGPNHSGNYSIASTMADYVMVLPTVFGTILFPKVSGISDVRQRLHITRKASIAVASVLVPLCIVASLLAVPVVHLMFGATFSEAAPAFVWLMPGIIFLGVESVAVQFLNSFGFPPSVIAIWIFSTALNVGLNLWAIPAYGIDGAAAVSSLTYITTSIFIFVVIARTWKSAIAESAMQ